MLRLTMAYSFVLMDQQNLTSVMVGKQYKLLVKVLVQSTNCRR